MGKQKRKLTAAQKAAKKKRREEYQTVFINGNMKRVRRPPMIEGMSVDDFIRANADPIWLHQEELWQYIETEDDSFSIHPHPATVRPGERERVEFITTETGVDLVVAFAIGRPELDAIFSLILHRTPKYERVLPPEERGVVVSHELLKEQDRDLATRIVVDGAHIDIATPLRTYLVDVSAVDPEEVDIARSVFRLMHRHGGFELDLR